MNMVRIKAVFPANYYTLRKISVKQDGKKVSEVGNNQTIELDVPENSELQFKLDYHKAKISIPSDKEDLYVILYLDYKNPVDLMFKNCLRAKIVSKEEFDSFTPEFYSAVSKQIPLKQDFVFYLTLLLGVVLSLELVYLYFGFDAEEFSYGLIFGGLSFIGFLISFLTRNKLTQAQYYLRVLAFSVLSFTLLMFLKFTIWMRVVSFVLSGILLITGVVKMRLTK